MLTADRHLADHHGMCLPPAALVHRLAVLQVQVLPGGRSGGRGSVAPDFFPNMYPTAPPHGKCCVANASRVHEKLTTTPDTKKIHIVSLQQPKLIYTFHSLLNHWKRWVGGVHSQKYGQEPKGRYLDKADSVTREVCPKIKPYRIIIIARCPTALSTQPLGFLPSEHEKAGAAREKAERRAVSRR